MLTETDLHRRRVRALILLARYWQRQRQRTWMTEWIRLESDWNPVPPSRRGQGVAQPLIQWPITPG